MGSRAAYRAFSSCTAHTERGAHWITQSDWPEQGSKLTEQLAEAREEAHGSKAGDSGPSKLAYMPELTRQTRQTSRKRGPELGEGDIASHARATPSSRQSVLNYTLKQLLSFDKHSLSFDTHTRLQAEPPPHLKGCTRPSLHHQHPGLPSTLRYRHQAKTLAFLRCTHDLHPTLLRSSSGSASECPLRQRKPASQEVQVTRASLHCTRVPNA